VVPERESARSEGDFTRLFTALERSCRPCHMTSSRGGTRTKRKINECTLQSCIKPLFGEFWGQAYTRGVCKDGGNRERRINTLVCTFFWEIFLYCFLFSRMDGPVA